jgi:ElaB/YqjD/DUF883 family membrane-anchored ribosome-binding protein
MFPTKPVKDSTINNIEESACDMANSITSAGNQAGQKVRSLYNNASDEVTHASEKVTGEIRSNPVRSTVIALGVGALIGALLRR